MFDLIFYEDAKGDSEVIDFINELSQKTDKDSRINYYKIMAYFNMLREFGTRIGAPVTKHLDGEIWELRPIKNRVLYAYLENDVFIILHCFVKKTKKTPRREIEKAKRNLKDHIEREGSVWQKHGKKLKQV